MNSYIEKVESLPGSVWQGLQISGIQTILLFVFAGGIGCWLLEKSKYGFWVGMISMNCFLISRSKSFSEANNQKKLVVYNISQRSGMDFILGRHHVFLGDSELVQNKSLRNFHIQPSRIQFRATAEQQLSSLVISENYIQYCGTRILLANSALRFKKPENKQMIDLLILSGNPRIYMSFLAGSVEIRQVVFDGSVPAWKSNFWKKDCDSLKIPWHDVKLSGAYVMKLR
jgi:competence protein ComEC